MNTAIRSILLLSLLSAAAIAQAEIVVQEAWVRATVAQQHATGAFLQIRSSQDVRLVAVQTAAAGISEVHEMKMENDVMKMRALPYLDIAAGKTVELKPGGLHIMLMDLHGQAKAGEKLPLKLIFETKDKKRETVEVNANVKNMNASDGKM
ncbi:MULTISPECIES: copper chaperone PCu(A)C [unclassified Undibacterium]|uniref:copper chaperone PCu(A)C n=1 Tax=unclassified Undibacterium TaxID=2630295 RepID=UPI002AC99C2C|nr:MULTISPECIES: copper chaperone PCu(A)C [unclassified Undibacterium]MEB0139990.1 copper chaperone PCu(A)C [Undibacterium sp. CCC2.1]MEB0173010.1 copper chaperone PCu(A)C [Undibacterium sp. CCC1.1]MEB0176836.1 copper chaperone PCu(A)C [Undibacterium sp. CCC3.4]MEB0216068.1 copper chaperone PCu(A)C [Undibacterium sp. 5I2]WPX42214.1 copper chaperone PCu(A)C [Undibacterium sp. CCC3.4]